MSTQIIKTASLPVILAESIKAFAARVQKDTYDRYIEDSTPFNGEAAISSTISNANRASVTNIKAGKKYTKVDVGGAGRFMVDNATEEIFGIKAYGVIHKGHQYGTLDTVADWFWGEYYPVKETSAPLKLSATSTSTPAGMLGASEKQPNISDKTEAERWMLPDDSTVIVDARWEAAIDLLNELSAVVQELAPKHESVIRKAQQKLNELRYDN